MASSARAAGVDLEDLPEELSRRFQGELEALDHRVAEDLALAVPLADDLGSRRMTDWAADTLFTLVNGRYLARRPTVITTAYEDVDAEVAREADARRRQEFLVERVGQRLWSRLLEMCVLVPTGAPADRDARRPAARPSTLGGLRRSQDGGG